MKSTNLSKSKGHNSAAESKSFKVKLALDL